jgi:hypothetical protein
MRDGEASDSLVPHISGQYSLALLILSIYWLISEIPALVDMKR